MNKCIYCDNPLIEPLHIQKGFHISCQQKKDREEMEAAKKNIAANKAPNAKFVRGGSTGMVQQKGADKVRSSGLAKIGIKKEIKDACKMFKHDLVLMHIGSYYDVIEEDADYFHKEFKFDYNPSPASYNVTGFPTYAIDKWKKKLLEKGINFCIVDEVEPVNKTIVREVIFSSCSPESVGLTFTGGPSSK